MTIVLTGGGSGGHITPILAVAAELKRLHPGVRLVYIGQRGDNLGDIPAADANIDAVYTVRAGKFRRYHGEGWRQLLDLPTLIKNVRDFFYVLVGIVQSHRLLKRLQPDVIFVKGGFVGVPVGLAAASLRLPYVTHDSDAIPGLANRIIARWASQHAVALPVETYQYPRHKTITTGVPLQRHFVPVDVKHQQAYRREIDVPAKAQLLFIIGGGLGSDLINQAVSEAAPHLLAEHRELYVVHVVGRAHLASMTGRYEELLTPAQQQRLRVFDFVNDVYRYSGAADVVVTRAGATNLAEFALQGKACVVVPSAVLTGGHQLKNAAYLREQGAAKVIDEDELAADPGRLARLVNELLADPEEREHLGQALHRFARPHAAKELAQLLLDTVHKSNGRR